LSRILEKETRLSRASFGTVVCGGWYHTAEWVKQVHLPRLQHMFQQPQLHAWYHPTLETSKRLSVASNGCP
jgi:hypothetical protein